MLMSPNKDETAVHGCHCPGDMAVRMRKVLARPRGWCRSVSLAFLVRFIRQCFCNVSCNGLISYVAASWREGAALYNISYTTRLATAQSATMQLRGGGGGCRTVQCFVQLVLKRSPKKTETFARMCGRSQRDEIARLVAEGNVTLRNALNFGAVLAPKIVAKSKTDFYFSQRLRQQKNARNV